MPTTATHSPLIAEAVAGLLAPRKTLPCKLLYDQRGSELFDQICELPEYYPTRTESAIMADHIDHIAERLGPGVLLVEIGSGSSTKTRALLDHLDRPAGYVPVDISEEHLLATADTLGYAYPDLPIHPLVADYDHDLQLPEPALDLSFDHVVIYFPGSTIGNFDQRQARHFLHRLANLARNKQPGEAVVHHARHPQLLIGVDLVKPLDVLIPAYDDAAGVTADFNYNLLARLNREADAEFDPDRFRYEARWDHRHQRIEAHLVATTAHTVHAAGHAIDFDEGESIWTESSHKYTTDSFTALAAPDWTLSHTWTDPEPLFAVHLLEAR